MEHLQKEHQREVMEEPGDFEFRCLLYESGFFTVPALQKTHNAEKNLHKIR